MSQDSLTAGLYARQQKGLVIAQTKKVRQTRNDLWLVPSQSHPGTYLVDTQEQTCTCPDHEATRGLCKHLHAVTFTRLQTVEKDGTVLTTDAVKITYSQNWSAYNRAQCEEKEIVQRLLRGLCDGIVQPPHVRGRPSLPLADVVYGAAMKVYTTFSGRRATTDLRECETKGLIDHTPHYNSISNYLAKPELTPLFKTLIEESACPLKAVETAFAVDSTGYSTSTYARWYDFRWGREKKHQVWLKAHTMVGVRTGIVTSVEVTPGNMADSPEFPGLVERTAERFPVSEVSADKAYISHRNLDAVAKVGGVPYIPFKSNNKAEGPEEWRKLWHLFNYRRGEFDKRYHLRSRSESTFSAQKRLLGGAVRSKKFEAQVNEVLVKVLCYNLTVLVHEMFELGITPVFLPVAVLEVRMADEETIDRLVDRFKEAKVREAMSRGLLVVDENVDALATALRAANIRVIVPRKGMDDADIKTELLPNRILVTKNTKDFLYDASSYEYGIIALEKLKLIDPEPNPAKNVTVQLISRAIIDFHLWTKRSPFVLVLEQDGRHRLQELHE